MSGGETGKEAANANADLRKTRSARELRTWGMLASDVEGAAAEDLRLVDVAEEQSRGRSVEAPEQW